MEDEFEKSDDLGSFLNIVENGMKNLYHIASKGIVSGYRRLSEDCKFIESIAYAYDRALVYQISSRFIAEGLISEGIKILSACCDQITDNGKKLPAKDFIQKLRTAFFQIPDLKEKPARIILEHENLPVNILICLTAVMSDNKIKNIYPILKELTLLQTSFVWNKLSFEEKEDFKNLTASFFKDFTGKKIDELIVNKEKKSLISDDFMNVFFPDAKGETDAVQETVTKDVAEEPMINEQLLQTGKTESAKSDTDTEGLKAFYHPNLQSKLSDEKIFKDAFPPLDAMADVVEWMQDIPQHELNKVSEWLEKHDDPMADLRQMESKLKDKIKSLNSEIDNYKTEKNELHKKVESLNKQIEEKNIDIRQLKADIKSQIKDHEEIVRNIITDGEEREKRLEQEFKNRIASKIQHLVDDFRYLKSESDLNVKSEGQEKVFCKLTEIFKYTLDIQVNV